MTEIEAISCGEGDGSLRIHLRRGGGDYHWKSGSSETTPGTLGLFEIAQRFRYEP